MDNLLHSCCLLQFPLKSEPKRAFIFHFLFMQKMAATLSPTSPSTLQQGGIFQALTAEIKGICCSVHQTAELLGRHYSGNSCPRHSNSSMICEGLWYPECEWHHRGALPGFSFPSLVLRRSHGVCLLWQCDCQKPILLKVIVPPVIRDLERILG